MADIPLLRGLGIMVVAAALVVLVARAVRVPSIVAYVVAGLLVGPAAGLLEVTEAIELISSVGIALLLFLVGLELSLEKIRGVAKVAVIAGLGQVVLTAAGGYAVSHLLGFSPIESAFLATALTFSSTVVVVKLLNEKAELDSLYGRIAVGVLLVQDLVVIVLLTLLAGIGGSGNDLDPGSTASGFARAIGGITLLLVFAMAAAHYILPRVFGWIAGSLEGLFIWSLSWCFLLVAIAERLELSIEIGAFVAGVSLAQLPFQQELRRRVHPLMNFFIAIFFTSLGVRMDINAGLQYWFPALVLSAFVLVVKSSIFMWVIARLRYPEPTAFRASVTLAQISEFSFIFAAMGVSTGLIGDSILALIGIVGLTTIVLSSYMILYSPALYGRLKDRRIIRSFGARPGDEADEERGVLSGHVVVIGMNSLGSRLVRELIARGETVLAIDTDLGKLSKLHCRTLLGNIDQPAVLEAANLPEARLVVSALQIEDANNLLTYRCRQLGVPCSVHAFDRSVVRELQQIGANHLMIPNNNGIKRMMAELRKRGVLTS